MKDVKKPTDRLETFSDLQGMVLEVLGGKADEVMPKPNSEPAPVDKTDELHPISNPFPTPRTYEDVEYYGADDVAKIIGVTRRTVLYWHQKGLFTADRRAHGGMYLYTVEHVEQLKSVYRPDWNQPACLVRVDESTLAPVSKPDEKTANDKPDEREIYLKKIFADIAEAKRHLTELPSRDMRGLEVETLQRTRIFFLPNYRHPKSPNSLPTPRFIARLGSDNDLPAYNAILTPTGRDRFKNSDRWEAQKTLTAGDKLLFYPQALEESTFFVTEGEINAASIMQATKFFVKACALGGAGIFEDLKRRLAELKTKPHIIILFDNDKNNKKNTGKEKALKLQKVLADMGIAAVPVFIDDFISKKQKEAFDKIGKKNIDPNDILQSFGDIQLKGVIEKILDQTRADFKKAEEEIEQMNLFKRKQADTPPPKKESSANKAQKNQANYDSFRIQIMLDTIDPAGLEYSDWLAVNTACKNIGLDYATVDTWNRRDTKGYNAIENQSSWNGVHDPSYDIKTLHGKAKRFGYREADARRQWYELHPELKPSTRARNISEETQRELDDAIIWLETLSADDFSADDAYNPDKIHAAALAQTYGFAAAAEKFFAVIKTAKAQAQARIKEADTGLTAPLDTDELAELGALANLHLETLRKNVAREVQTLNREQKAFAKQQAEEQTRQHAVKARTERQNRVAENIKTLIELRKEYKKNPSKELAEKMKSIIFNSCDVTTDRYTGEVKAVKATAANANLFFTFDPYIDGVIGYDEFQQADVILKCPPWRHDDDCIHTEWTDRDDAQLRTYLRRYYIEFANKNLTDDMTISYSDKHSFHPVKDYFANLPKWDGKTRAETVFIDFLKVDDTPYAREVTKNWLFAAIARIFHPGCEYQIAPIIHGNQGIGKGFILKRLGGAWYGAISENVDDSHAVDSIQNIWIGEFKEMKGLRRADVNAIKAFIDTSADNRRPPYGRRARQFFRHCVFIITVNDDQFLSDVTGNRRFPVLECKLPRGQYIKGLTDDYISQLWAEVYHYYCELRQTHSDLKEKDFVKILEEKLELSAATKIQVEDVAQRFMRDDGMTGEIEAFLNTKIPPAVIWNLFNKEERRKFIAEGQIIVDQTELNTARRARGGRNVQKDIDEIDRILRSGNGVIKKTIYLKGEQPQDKFVLFGTEYREHICAAEILNEAFPANDRRKSMFRIHEILATLDDWIVGKGTPRDPVYGNQRKVFYRTSQPDEPTTDDTPPAQNDSGNHDAGNGASELQGNTTVTENKSQSDIWEEIADLEDPPF